MSLIRRRRRKSKKSFNPYANLGLDKFAVVAAELADKREQLATQLGVPVSVVRFALGSQSKWSPVIVSPSKKKDVVSRSTAAASRMSPEMKIVSLEDSAAAASAPASVDLNIKFIETEQVKAAKGGEKYSYDKGSKVWPEVAKAASVVADTAGAVGLAKVVAFRAAMATVLARSSVLVRKSQAKETTTVERNLLSQMSGEGNAIGNSSGDTTSKQKRISRQEGKSTAGAAQPLGMASQSQLLQPTPPPVPRNIGSGVAAEEPSTSGSHEDGGAAFDLAATRQRTSGFKFKFLRESIHRRKIRSASSSPRDSRRSSLDKKPSGARDQAKMAIEPHLDSPLSAVRIQQEFLPHKRWVGVNSKSRVEELSLALGLLIVLGALMLGHIAAILGVLGWWYVVPCLRKASAGDKALIRTSFGRISTARTTGTSTITSKKTITQVGSSIKGDTQSTEYKKKVIMNGLLHRGRL